MNEQNDFGESYTVKLTEQEEADLLDELYDDYNWRDDFDDSMLALDHAIERRGPTVERLAKEIWSNRVQRQHHNVKVDMLNDVFGPGSFFKRQAD